MSDSEFAEHPIERKSGWRSPWLVMAGLVAVFGCAALFLQCGPRPKGVNQTCLEEDIRAHDEWKKILETVADEPSAVAAIPKLNVVTAKRNTLFDEMHAQMTREANDHPGGVDAYMEDRHAKSKKELAQREVEALHDKLFRSKHKCQEAFDRAVKAAPAMEQAFQDAIEITSYPHFRGIHSLKR